jgi:hypothetical protein
MNLAVKFYKDEPDAPLGMPADWPSQCRQIDDATEYTAEPGPWLIMSVEEYNSYREANMGAYEQYQETYLGADGQPHPIMSMAGIYLRVRNWLGMPA